MSNEQDKQSDDLLEELTVVLNGHSGFVAVGLDMAASEGNWGICLLAINPDLTAGTLSFLLPQAKINKDNSVSPTLYCRPSFQILKSTLQSVANSGLSGSMGVDVPFGWPVEHSRFVDKWSAAKGWQARGGIPDRAHFEMRLCDLKLNEFESSIDPFAVGADTIAQAAYKWASCRHELSGLVGQVDLGLTPTTESGLTTFESYPGAFVKLAYPEFSDYKSKPSVRHNLLSCLKQDYSFACDDKAADWLEWAINQKGKSPDAFDSLLCAITAWGHLRWKRDRKASPFTAPTKILGQPPSELQKEQIRQEGWILIPAK